MVNILYSIELKINKNKNENNEKSNFKCIGFGYG